MKYPRTHVDPTPFSSIRAIEIDGKIRQRARATGLGMYNTDRAPFMTDGEDEYVRSVWATMSGASCWDSAFQQILTGELDQKMEVRQ